MKKFFRYEEDLILLGYLDDRASAIKNVYLRQTYTEDEISNRVIYLNDLRLSQSPSIDQLIEPQHIKPLTRAYGLKSYRFGRTVTTPEIIDDIVKSIDEVTGRIQIVRRHHPSGWMKAIRPTLDRLVFKYKMSSKNILNIYYRESPKKKPVPEVIPSIEELFGTDQAPAKTTFDEIERLDRRIDVIERLVREFSEKQAHVDDISTAIRELVAEYRERNRILNEKNYTILKTTPSEAGSG